MSNVFELEASLGIDTSKYKKGIKEAIEEAEKLRDELNKTGKETKETGREIDKEGEEAEDSAKSNKKLGEEIKRAGSSAEESKSKFAALGGAIKDGLATVAKIGIAATGAAATGVATLVKQSISAYAEYEQLTGGIETLFGDSANKVIANSEKAFATAGMSVNEYMETSIQGAAALINSLGGDTAQAAELIDISIQDMSDNVNKMGTSMESVQNAYRGFSRQNFTMLDNLSLGFAGTKEGMQQLLDKARELSGVEYDINSYADIVKAIHVVQTEMGITGTTAKEAAGTITGSIASVKAAWKNLSIEMAKENGDVDTAFQTLGDNVGAVVENMLPKVQNSLGGIGKLIESAAPQVTQGIKNLLPKVLPSLIKSAGQIVSSLGQGMIQATPELLDMGKNALKTLSESFTAADIDIDNSVFAKLLGAFAESAPEYINYAETILANLGNALIHADHANFAQKIGSVIVSGINSVTDLLADLDMNQVGRNIADFMNAFPWRDIATSMINLLGSAIGSLGNIASGFFDNMDGVAFMDALSVIAAPKLLSSMLSAFKTNSDCQSNFASIKDYLSQEIGGSGKDAGMSWSNAFMAGLEAFGLGWAVGTWLRDNVVIGEKTLGEWVDAGLEKLLGEIPENEFNTPANTGVIYYEGKRMEVDPNSQVYKTYNPEGYNEWLQKYAIPGGFTADSQALVPRVEGDVAGQPANNLKEKPESRRNLETFSYYYKNGLNTAYKYDENNQLSEAWLKYGGLAFGNGGHVTRPTIALIGEKEPETVVPDSKLNSIGSTTNYITINVEGYSIKNDEEFTELLSRKLSELSVRQQRAVGGAGW